MAKSSNFGSQTVIVDSQGLWTPCGRRFMGIQFPADIVCYDLGREFFATVECRADLLTVLARLGVNDPEGVIDNALQEAPVRARLTLPNDELRRICAGVQDGWFIY